MVSGPQQRVVPSLRSSSQGSIVCHHCTSLEPQGLLRPGKQTLQGGELGTHLPVDRSAGYAHHSYRGRTTRAVEVGGQKISPGVSAICTPTRRDECCTLRTTTTGPRRSLIGHSRSAHEQSPLHTADPQLQCCLLRVSMALEWCPLLKSLLRAVAVEAVRVVQRSTTHLRTTMLWPLSQMLPE
jgi:hypothetical protein